MAEWPFVRAIAPERGLADGSDAPAAGDHVLERRAFLFAGLLVPFPTRPEEVDMLIISFEGHAFLLSGGVRTQIDRPEQIDQLKAAGVPEVQGDHRWAAAFPVGVKTP